MRDYLIFAIIFGMVPFIIKRPVVGILAFTWVSLMNPHRLAYGAAYDFPFAAMIAVLTLASLLFSKEPKRFPWTALTVVLTLFLLWMTFTSFFALEPELVWMEWNRVMKTMLMVFVAMLALNTEKDIKAFVAVIGVSLGFYGMKGGIFTLASGGSNHVFGPEGSYITDNNALALALVTAVPAIWYLQTIATSKWLRLASVATVLLTVVAAAGSYSRGALLAGGAMLVFLWLKSPYKLRSGIALALIVPMVYLVMPDQWFHRMETIDNYQADASAMGRINAWHFAINVAADHLLGGGYNVFTRKMFLFYAPEPLNHHAAHSIYFQVLGEHGFIGLALFLLVMLLAWRSGSRILKYCRGKEELRWASTLAAMCQVSIIGYAVGGAFLTLAYYDLYYDLIVVLVLLEKLLLKQDRKGSSAPTPAAAGTLAFRPGGKG